MVMMMVHLILSINFVNKRDHWTKMSVIFRSNVQLSLITKYLHRDGLVQERRNSIADTLELRLSCTNPSIFSFKFH